MKAFLLLLTFSFLYSTQVLSQAAKIEHDARVEMAEAAVSALKSGGLIVRLPTNAKKIAGMQEVLSRDELSPNNRGRLQERLDETIAHTRTHNLLLIQLLSEQYQLGPLYFIPDTAYTLLQAKNSHGFFYNEQLELDPEIIQPSGDILIMRIGFTDASETARAEAFILSNSSQEDLIAPFPGAVTFDNVGFLFNKMLAPEIAERRRLEGAVKRLVRKLTLAMNREKW